MFEFAQLPKRIRSWARPCLAVIAVIVASALSSCAGGYWWFEPGYESAPEPLPGGHHPYVQKDYREPGLDGYAGNTR